MRTRPSAPVLVAVALPLLLALAVAVIGITARLQGMAGTGVEPAAPSPEALKGAEGTRAGE